MSVHEIRATLKCLKSKPLAEHAKEVLEASRTGFGYPPNGKMRQLINKLEKEVTSEHAIMIAEDLIKNEIMLRFLMDNERRQK